MQNVKHNIIAHLMMLGNSFDGYFSNRELIAAQQWIINPFLFNLTTMSDDDNLKEDLIEIKVTKNSNRSLKNQRQFLVCCKGSFSKPS